MTDLSALPALLARVEAATGPDRGIDAQIALTFQLPQQFFGEVVDCQFSKDVDGPEYHVDKATWSGMGELYTAPAFTSSLDATVALVRKKRPGAIWRVGEDGAIALAVLSVPSYVVHKGVTAATPPLALLAALLRSMIEEEGK